jgi:hypothetical protein
MPSLPAEKPMQRKPGAWRSWQIPDEALFEPMAPEDLDAAEGEHADEWGITQPRSSEPGRDKG